MGPVILARGLADGRPYAVKVHGSALEYTVRPEPRALPALRARGRARRRRRAGGLAPHGGEPLGGAGRGDRRCRERTRLGPARAWTSTRSGPATADLERAGARGRRRRRGLLGRRARRRARRCGRSTPRSDRIVSYVGKLIVSKGVDLLLAAWPLVVARVPDARLVVVGFGTYREALGRFVEALRRRRRRRRCARSPRAVASSRAGRRASCATCARSSTGVDRRLARRRAGRRGADPLHRPARARRPARPAARLRGAGDAEHLPRGVRHGRRGGGRLRRAAAVGGPLRDGRGHGHAGARAGGAS